MRTSALLVAPLLLVGLLGPVLPAAASHGERHGHGSSSADRLVRAVTVNHILKYERAFQRIANANDGTRASGTPGFEASADYVKKQLRAAGYRVTEQEFDFPFYEELAPATLAQTAPTPTTYETATLDYSFTGDVTGTVVPALNLVIPATQEPSSAAGCLATDYAPAPDTPAVALAQRGTCDFAVKVANAVSAGYDAVVIFNEGQPGRDTLLDGATLGGPQPVPVVGISYADGVALYEQSLVGPVTLQVVTSTDNHPATTRNIIADTRRGDPDNVVVVGAHLDSVLAGPGINDNGSGSATILEIATQLSRLKFKPQNQVRFAFWGAEENGTLGSEHYVNDLIEKDELETIYANLNFDMLGSPNYVRFVYDGDGSGDPDAAGPPGSAQIEQVFTDYFDGRGLASEPTAFDGRSDYGPFIAQGIPAGGLFSGAEGIKTEAEAAVYGGTAGIAYDVNYHQAGDNLNNLSTRALWELGDAAAFAVATLATSPGLYEDGSRVAAKVAAPVSDFKGSQLIR